MRPTSRSRLATACAFTSNVGPTVRTLFQSREEILSLLCMDTKEDGYTPWEIEARDTNFKDLDLPRIKCPLMYSGIRKGCISKLR